MTIQSRKEISAYVEVRSDSPSAPIRMLHTSVVQRTCCLGFSVVYNGGLFNSLSKVDRSRSSTLERGRESSLSGVLHTCLAISLSTRRS
jgi:hypothetical protein